jgi:hypothetical protein
VNREAIGKAALAAAASVFAMLGLCAMGTPG